MEVSEEQLQWIQDLLEKYFPECAVWAYGSRVEGNPKKHSDLDLVIIGGGLLPWNHLAKLEYELAESDLPFRVDICDWHTKNDLFRERIRRRHVVVQ